MWSKLKVFSMATHSECTDVKVVMVRHGESEGNRKNLFCGWLDVELSPKGKDEVKEAGIALKEANYKFDVAYTSMLTRAQSTLQIIFDQLGQPDIPVRKTWRLNEMHYGALTGLNKAEVALKYGQEQVTLWRKSYDTEPPPMEPDHKLYRAIVEDPRYATCPDPPQFPKFESLKMAVERCLPFWNEGIVPDIKAGKRVIIVAHGNILRGLIRHLDQISEQDFMKLDIPTGSPFFYTLDKDLKPVPRSLQFLKDAAVK